MPTFFITKADTSIVCPTLVEKSLLAENIRAYIWVVQNDQDTPPVYFTCAEESTELQRYNQFSIIETTNPDPFAGEVELSVGSHEYKIYEISSVVLSGITNLAAVDYSILTLVEESVLKVIPSAITNTEYPDTLTNTVYNV